MLYHKFTTSGNMLYHKRHWGHRGPEFFTGAAVPLPFPFEPPLLLGVRTRSPRKIIILIALHCAYAQPSAHNLLLVTVSIVVTTRGLIRLRPWLHSRFLYLIISEPVIRMSACAGVS